MRVRLLADGAVRDLPAADALLLVGAGRAQLVDVTETETASLDGGETPEGRVTSQARRRGEVSRS